MSSVTQHGYLVIADISGYTSFVAKTELEHSHEILSELLGLLVDKIKPLMTLSKLEGDAVFAYAGEEKITRGETLLEFLEGIHVAFRDRQISMKRATTSTCLACQNIPSLDLKFIAHHGDYIVQHRGEIRELVGSDVNLIHRLTKNHVADETGWHAYLTLTKACLDHLYLNLADTHMQIETYEQLGEVTTYSIDLHKRYDQTVSGRGIFLTEENADLSFGGTRMHVLVRLHFPLPGFVRKLMARRVLLDTHHYDRVIRDTARLAGEQYQAAASRE